jgi:hypothetical protein
MVDSKVHTVQQKLKFIKFVNRDDVTLASSQSGNSNWSIFCYVCPYMDFLYLPLISVIFKLVACYHSVQNILSSLVSKNVNIKIYRTVILPVVLYGCESWSLTLREECRLRVLENKELRRIFGPKRDEVTGEWRRLHNKELYAVYSSPSIIRVIKSRRLRWAGHVARMGERRGAYRALVGKPEGRRPLGRVRRRWEDNIKMDLREVGCGGADWVDLAQDRDGWRALVYTVMNLRVPSNAGNFLSSLGHFSFSGRTLLHGVS